MMDPWRAQPRTPARGGTGRRRAGSRAFTFVELVLGMAVTALCLCATAAVMAAVGAGWKQQGVSQGTFLVNRQAVMRVQDLVRPAKLIGLVRTGTLASNSSNAACVMLWKSDTSGGAADRQIQFSEIALLQHDRSTNTLKYYSVKYPASLTAAQIAALEKTYKYSDLTSSNAPEDFKALNYVTGQTVATNVTGATFYVSQPLGQSSQLPTFEFQLAVTRDGKGSEVDGSVALRNPDYKPAQ
jgi:hypothetical protein